MFITLSSLQLVTNKPEVQSMRWNPSNCRLWLQLQSYKMSRICYKTFGFEIIAITEIFHFFISHFPILLSIQPLKKSHSEWNENIIILVIGLVNFSSCFFGSSYTVMLLSLKSSGMIVIFTALFLIKVELCKVTW